MIPLNIQKSATQLSCVLENEDEFYAHAVKAIEKTESYGLLCCKDSRYNGKVKLSYDVSGFTTLRQALNRLSCEQYLGVLRDLSDAAAKIEGVAQLSLQNTLLDPDYVLLNTSKERLEIGVVVLPLRFQLNDEQKAEGRNSFFRFLKETVNLASNLGRQDREKILDALRNADSLDDLSERLNRITLESGHGPKPNPKPDSKPDPKPGPKPDPKPGLKPSGKPLGIVITQILSIGLGIAGVYYISWISLIAVAMLDAIATILIFTRDKKSTQPDISQGSIPDPIPGGGGTEILFNPVIRLVGINTPMRLIVQVNKAHFRVGRGPGKEGLPNDGILPEQLTTVSANHCVIRTMGDEITLTDNSSNGTWINGKRIDKGVPCRLQINDTLKLAGYSFKVESTH